MTQGRVVSSWGAFCPNSDIQDTVCVICHNASVNICFKIMNMLVICWFLQTLRSFLQLGSCFHIKNAAVNKYIKLYTCSVYEILLQALFEPVSCIMVQWSWRSEWLDEACTCISFLYTIVFNNMVFELWWKISSKPITPLAWARLKWFIVCWGRSSECKSGPESRGLGGINLGLPLWTQAQTVQEELN